MSRCSVITPIMVLVLSIWIWRRSAPVARNNAQVAGYRFVQEWPPAVCSVNPSLCQGTVRRFTIHGLWPYDSNGTSITDCRGSRYNVSLVSSFRTDLNNAWPAYDGRPYENLWRHEWNKHGTCSEQRMPQVNYFRNSAVILYSRHNILQTLQSRGISIAADPIYSQRINPDNRDYKVQDILDAFPTTVQVNCRTNSARRVLLYEIFICINLQVQPTDCRKSSHRSCGGIQAKITFLA